ncbi:carbonic anhydrase [Gaetbulibacter saemankumensis]|uniref:carbonic anhydrase n=1 Tax=Gaetbulibacter saemankumensis TaxID=311208 RepID=UPI00041EE4D6|nr:carbonic anhydrase family protein [Gaetbulibacter saemankumensis]
MKLNYYIYGFILIIFTSCKDSNKKLTQESNHHLTEATHWSYSGETAPEHWAELEQGSDCDGHNQSPINIITKDVVETPTKNHLNILYSPQTFIKKVINNGHTIQFDFESGDSISYLGDTHYLKQIHFHEPSEHKINGIIYPIETHLVHLNKSGNITVLSILGEEGEESQVFEFLESFLPLKNGESKDIHKNIDLSSFFLNEKHFYSYTGSLTTPPCWERVNWVVFKEPIILSVDEVEKLRNNMPINNYRNEQPLNNRIVTFNY